jgi:glutamine amidotransferase
MRSLWLGSAEPPSVAERFAIVRRFAWELRHLGMANFIYADGDTLFAHGHRRQHEGGEIRPPGLFTIRRECARGDGAEQSTGVTVTPAFDQHVVLIASVPLTDEPWRALGDGEILTVTAGDLVTFAADSAPDLAKPDRSPDS